MNEINSNEFDFSLSQEELFSEIKLKWNENNEKEFDHYCNKLPAVIECK